MTEAEVQALVNKSLEAQKVEFTTKIEAIEKKSADQLAAANAELKKERVSNRRKAITDKFNACIAAETLLPAAFTMFEKMTQLKNDEQVLTIEDSTVEEFIKSHAVKPKNTTKKVVGDADADDPDVSDMTVGEAANVMKNHYVRKLKLDPRKLEDQQAAHNAAMKAHPELATQYRYGRLADKVIIADAAA